MEGQTNMYMCKRALGCFFCVTFVDSCSTGAGWVSELALGIGSGLLSLVSLGVRSMVVF